MQKMMPLLSVDDALAQIVAGIGRVGDEDVDLTKTSMMELLGRVLAQSIAAKIPCPPCDVSAMDGYGVRADDVAVLPTILTVIGESAAGKPFKGKIESGEAVQILTGAVCPKDIDVIVLQEDTSQNGNKITITSAPEAGQYIRKAGHDFAKGDVLAEQGQGLNARLIALIAAAGHHRIKLKKKPLVAVVCTGDELVPPGVMPKAHQIISSNGILLSGLLTAMGADVMPIKIIPDSPETLEKTLIDVQGSKPDLIVTSGGASVGKHDGIAKLMTGGKHDLGFWRIAMRPGKPLIFGRFNKTPLLGLPGNPVSTGLCCMVFVATAIRAMLGVDNPARLPLKDGVLTEPLKANDQRQDFLRARISHGDNGEILATPFAKQDSAMLNLFAQADGLVVRPPHAPPAQAGDRVKLMLIPTFV